MSRKLDLREGLPEGPRRIGDLIWSPYAGHALLYLQCAECGQPGYYPILRHTEAPSSYEPVCGECERKGRL